MPTAQKNAGHASALTINGLTPGRQIVVCNMHMAGGVMSTYTVMDYPRAGVSTASRWLDKVIAADNAVSGFGQLKQPALKPELVVRVRDRRGVTSDESLKTLGIIPLCIACKAWSWWRFTVDHRKLHLVRPERARELTLADDRDFYFMPELELAGCRHNRQHTFPRFAA